MASLDTREVGITTKSFAEGGISRQLRGFSGGVGGVEGGEAKSRVVRVEGDDDFKAVMAAAEDSDQLAVVDFTAAWCGPCKVIAPFFDQLSLDLCDVTFVKVDIDKEELNETVSNAGISAVPTFQFYKGKKKVGEFSGADREKLKDMIHLLRKV